VSRENLGRAENALRNLIARDAGDPLWDRELATGDNAAADVAPRPDVHEAIAAALAKRPELDELARRLERQDVEIESAVDRVRPQVDLVAAYNGRGLAGTQNEDAIQPFGPVVVPDDLRGGLGRSLLTMGENEFPDASVGVSVVIPIGNGAARQDVAIARAVRRQQTATLDAARQRVAMEVRNAIASLTSAAERIDAARAARAAAEVQLQAERDRFEAGTSNTFFILTRQNDLVAAQVAEAVASADYQKARTELARATGTLLDERGVVLSESEGVVK